METLINILLRLSYVLIGIAIGLSLYNPCDTNRDGKVTASDYVNVKNYIMGGIEND